MHKEPELQMNIDVLLSNELEWSSIPQIIYQSISSLSSKLTEQSNTIFELQNQLAAKASKSELKSSLNIKANSVDVLQSFHDLHSSIDLLPTCESLYLYLDKKVSVETMEHIEASIAALSKSLEQKANKDFVIHSLHMKENKTNVSDLRNQIETIHNTVEAIKSNQSQLNISYEKNQGELKTRFDSLDNDLDILIENIKTQFNSFNKTLNDFQQKKIDTSEFEKSLNNLKKGNEENVDKMINKTQNELRNEIMILKTIIEDQNKKLKEELEKQIIDCNEKNDLLINDSKKEINKIKTLIKTIDDNLTNMNKETLKQKTYQEQKTLDNQEEEQKKDKELQDTLSINQQKVIDELTTLKNELQRKVSFSDINPLLSKKVDIDIMNTAIADKASLSDVELFFKQSRENKHTYTHMNNHYNDSNTFYHENMSHSLTDFNFTIKDIKDSLVMKADIKEVLGYLNEKPSKRDINIALTQLHDEVDRKLSFEQYQKMMTNQNQINDLLCKENCIGKWLWTSNEMNQCNIKWNTQLSNLFTDNFYLEKETGIILIRSKGVYHISLGMFDYCNGAIQIIVNGLPLISYGNNNNTQNIDSIPNKNGVVGLQINEYISLEAKSRLSVSYSSNLRKEHGFLILKTII